jgi:hypothetical protein
MVGVYVCYDCQLEEGVSVVDLLLGDQYFSLVQCLYIYAKKSHSNKFISLCVISGFRRETEEISALLGYYAAYSGNSLPKFRDNLSVLSSKIK